MDFPFIVMTHEDSSDIVDDDSIPGILIDNSDDRADDQPTPSIFNSDDEPDYYDYDKNKQGFHGNNYASECNIYDYPEYNPTYFDDYCKDYYWCFREYDAVTCAPTTANGWTESEAMYVIGASYYAPMYILWAAQGLWIAPWTSCIWMAEYDYEYCDYLGSWAFKYKIAYEDEDGNTQYF